MFLFKTSGATLPSVVKTEKHAFRSQPLDWYIGELALVSKNLPTARGPSTRFSTSWHSNQFESLFLASPRNIGLALRDVGATSCNAGVHDVLLGHSI